MKTSTGFLIQTRAFGERLSDVTNRGVIGFYTEASKVIQDHVEEYLLDQTFIGKFVSDNDKMVVFKWLDSGDGRIWIFDKNFDMTEFDEARDYAREIMFSPDFYVYLKPINIVKIGG